jgi:hypothetical protein
MQNIFHPLQLLPSYAHWVINILYVIPLRREAKFHTRVISKTADEKINGSELRDVWI